MSQQIKCHFYLKHNNKKIKANKTIYKTVEFYVELFPLNFKALLSKVNFKNQIKVINHHADSVDKIYVNFSEPYDLHRFIALRSKHSLLSVTLCR